MNFLFSSFVSNRMTKIIPYILMVFAVLSCSAFLRKAFFIGEISIADCLVVIFSLLLVSLLYVFNEWIHHKTSLIEVDGLSQYKKVVDQELRDIRNAIDFIAKEKERDGSF